MFRIYTREVERERLRQAAYAMSNSRLSLNRHRTHRAGQRQLTVIGIVALERKDRTLYNEVRRALDLDGGTRFDQTYDLVQSRRASREQRAAFASNRLLRFGILPEKMTETFPLVETRALEAAGLDRIV